MKIGKVDGWFVTPNGHFCRRKYVSRIFVWFKTVYFVMNGKRFKYGKFKTKENAYAVATQLSREITTKKSVWCSCESCKCNKIIDELIDNKEW